MSFLVPSKFGVGKSVFLALAGFAVALMVGLAPLTCAVRSAVQAIR